MTQQSLEIMTTAVERMMAGEDTPLERLEKAMEMFEGLRSQVAINNFNASLAAVQAETPAIVKNKDNNTTRSRYANIAAINEAAVPIYTKHGFGLSFTTFQSEKEDHYGIRALLHHKDGHARTYDLSMPIDNTGLKGTRNKTDTHALASSLTYGRRYLVCMIFNIATEDDDGNAAGKRGQQQEELISVAQIEELEGIIEQTGTNKSAYLAYLKTDNLSNMPLRCFEEQKETLMDNYRKRMAKKEEPAPQRELEPA